MKRLLLVLAACSDALDQRLAIVDQPRILAVVATPAEAKPGEAVAYATLIAGPDGALPDDAAYMNCTSPKPPTEDNAASIACVAGDALVPAGVLPIDACATFGPDTVKPGFRPRDPDASGGFYQPVRVTSGDLLAIELSRVTCDLPNAPGDLAVEYVQRYVANANPVLHPLALPVVHAGDDVALTPSWDPPELFVYYDQLNQVLVTRREAMRVSYFATAGAMDVDASAVGEDDPATSASTVWHAPAMPGTQTVFLVLRDERGGVATQTIVVEVR